MKYEELDTDVLYRMRAGHFMSPEAEELPLQTQTFMKTLASPASYRVSDIDAVDQTLRGTSYKLPPDLNTLDTFSDTLQQVVASAAEKTIPTRL